jgi:hypothetical protein
VIQLTGMLSPPTILGEHKQFSEERQGRGHGVMTLARVTKRLAGS